MRKRERERLMVILQIERGRDVTIVVYMYMFFSRRKDKWMQIKCFSTKTTGGWREVGGGPWGL